MIAKRLLTRGEILDEENEKAAEGYQNMIGKYRQSREDLDTNELLKNSHMTMMQIEMVLRDLSDKRAQVPANPPNCPASGTRKFSVILPKVPSHLMSRIAPWTV